MENIFEGINVSISRVDASGFGRFCASVCVPRRLLHLVFILVKVQLRFEAFGKKFQTYISSILQHQQISVLVFALMLFDHLGIVLFNDILLNLNIT